MNRKNIWLLCMAALLLWPAAGSAKRKRLEPRFDEMCEMMNVVMYLTNDPVYTECEMESYLADVDNTFRAYAKHPAVMLADSLRRDGFKYDKPMAFALTLAVKNGHIVRNPKVNTNNPEYYARMDMADEDRLIPLIDDFYHTTRFHDFFRSHRNAYKEGEMAFREVSDKVYVSWYDTFFYPDSKTRLDIVVSYLNGPNNYSSTIFWKDGAKSIVATMGSCMPDKDSGKPHYDDVIATVLIHEFNHGFCNVLNTEYWDALKASAAASFDADKAFFRSSPYPNSTYLMNETFVESCVVHYLRSHPLGEMIFRGKPLAEVYLQLGEEVERWNLERYLVEILNERVSNPTRYRTMRDFMPVLSQRLADKIKTDGITIAPQEEEE